MGIQSPSAGFDSDADLEPGEWSLVKRRSELHRGRLGPVALDSITQELLEKAWRLFSYETFRSRLQELEEWEPFLAQEVTSRLNLVLTWQIFQPCSKTVAACTGSPPSRSEFWLKPSPNPESNCSAPPAILTATVLIY